MSVAFAWHVHHEILVEPLTGDGIAERRAYIEKAKPREEIATRLRLLREVRGQLPAEVVEAEQASVTARQAYDTARQASDTALRKHMPAIEALHAAECLNCPWDGHTIFPETR